MSSDCGWVLILYFSWSRLSEKLEFAALAGEKLLV